MTFPERVEDWAPYYQVLYEAGYTDQQIADTAEISRFVANRVRNRNYDRGSHQPSYGGAMAILNLIAQACHDGHIPEEALVPLEITP
jgi:hypothetical protein